VADVDGDGIGDAVVGAYYTERGPGALYVERGPLTADVTLADDGDALISGSSGYLGRHVRAGADVNGDGIGDIVTSAVYASGGALSSGIAYLILGPPTDMEVDDAQARLLGVTANGYAGSSVTAGDLDGDGYAEFLAASYGASQEGVVYVVSGTRLSGEISLDDADAVLEGGTRNLLFGLGGGAGGGIDTDDLNGDGRHDLLVGAANYVGDVRSGGAYLFYGPVSGELTAADADAVFAGEGVGDGTGTGVALGDLDADGLADLVMGAPTLTTTDARTAGGAYVVLAE
jgi:hypothetical protein